MTALRQGWLVARREVRERSRSRGLWAGTAFMLVVVVGAIVVPALAESEQVTRDVGFAGAVPSQLAGVLTEQGESVDVIVRVQDYDDMAAGEAAVRDKEIDVLVVDSRRLEWRGEPDERLRALITGAVQLVAAQERAAAAGITPEQLATLSQPVPVENVELGISARRSPDDAMAAYVMSILLLVALATYGGLVLTGVVQEKSSRVVEVLLARMPARTLLAGKVAGIGLIGFAQFAVTALAALIATLALDSVDIPAIGGDVLTWVVVWFVLGYAVYAMAYGAFGSLAARSEDASSIAAPVTTLLIVGYWASLIAVTDDPEGGWATLVSYFPATAAFAMPGRVALGAADWWEPFLAAGLALAAIAGLVVFAGRVYAGAILHTGTTVRFREAWHGTPAPIHDQALAPARRTRRRQRRSRTEHDPAGERRVVDPLANGALIGLAIAAAAAAFALARDVIVSVAVGAGVYAVASRIVKARHHDAAH
jgi:ABC-2 type transport system permease protein